MTVVGGALKLLGKNINDHGLVVAFKQAVMKKKPPGPKYDDTWDITLIFKWAARLGENERMALDKLRDKVVVLIRCDTFARGSDVAKLFRSEVKWAKDEVKVRFYRPKEWRPQSNRGLGEFSPWITVRKVDRPNICAYRALQVWLERTKRKDPKGGVICGLGKGGSVGAETIARISHRVMEEAGVPPKFRSQSIRGAASSAASDYGAPIGMVLNQGRWSAATTWKKHYYRKIERKAVREKEFDHVSAYVRRGIL